MDVTLFSIGVGAVAVILYCWLKWHYSYWMRKGLQQLEPDLFYGNFRDTVTNDENVGVTMERLYNKIKEKGWQCAGAYMIFKKIVIPAHPAMLKAVFQKDFTHFPGTGAFYHENDLLGQHLLVMEGDKWKSLRSKLTPAFTTGKIKIMFEGMTNKSDNLLKVVETYAGSKSVFDAKELASRYTTDVIVTTAFGLECDSLENPNHHFLKSVENILEKGKFTFAVEDIVPWSVLGFFGWKFIGTKKFENYFVDLITRAAQVREKMSVIRKDFFQMLLQLKNKGNITDDGDITEIKSKGANTLTETEVISQAFLFYFGGYETTATTISFSLLNLAQNPEMQDKVREEVREVLERHNGKFTYEAAMEMEYLEKVVLETLRMYPPFLMLFRRCAKDYKIPGTNATIKKGIQVLLPIGGVHYDPDYYPNPKAFNPENFSKENKAKRPECTFLSFGEGPRMCIGMRFGLLNAKVAIATVVKDHIVTVNKRTEVPIVIDSRKFVTSARGGIWLELTKTNTMYQKLQFYFNIILNWKLLVCLVLLKYVLVLYRTRRLLKFSFDHNGPAYFPLVGNWYWLIGKANLSAFIDLKRRFSLPCNLWLSQTCYNYVTDVPHEVKTILTHPNSYEKATFYSNFVSDLFENSLAVDKCNSQFISFTPTVKLTDSFRTDIGQDLNLEDNLRMRKLTGDEATKLRKQQIKAADDEDTEKMTFFDLHILGRSPYTENEFEDELFLLILAGISTTAVTISLALALLGMHASVQETLYEEVKRCVESETAILHEDIQELKFNEQVILETLRLFPALPFLGRYVRNDIDLGTKIIPKGSNVILPLYLIHRNEKFWPNPEKFDPDRFSSQNLANIVPGSYVPFSMGGRDCIGKTYSMIFMKMVVANVVKTFKIESNNQSVEDFKIASHIDLRPNGYIESFATNTCSFQTMFQKILFYFNTILTWKLLVYLVLLKYVLVLYRTRRLLKFSFDHNGPAYFPLVGNWYWLIGKANLSAFIDLKRCFSLPCNLWLSQSCYNYVTDVPHEVKTILTHPNSYEKATFYSNFVADMFENSLGVDKWEKARLHRRFVSKTFSLNCLRQFTRSFHTHISSLVERVSSISNVKELIQVTTETTACSILVSIMDLKSEIVVKELVYHFICYQKCFYNKTYSRALPPWLWKHLTNQGRDAIYHYSRMRDLLRTAIQLRKQQMNPADDEDTEKLTFFDLHVRGRSPCTENEFEDELFLLIIAGLSTTAVTISLALALLGMHASVQETLYEEVKRCVESETSFFNEDIQDLKYNEQVILETLRLFPALPLLGRYVRNDIDLGTKIIPKGSNVILPLYLIHRNEKFWPYPEQFDPDRFSSQNLANIVPGSYVPFSMGARDCIGKTYSMIFIKMVIASIVRKFKIESNNESVKDFNIASHIDLRPNGHVDCRFIPRDNGINNIRSYGEIILSWKTMILIMLIKYVMALVKNRNILKFSWSQNGAAYLPFIGNWYCMVGKGTLEGFIALKERHSLPCNLWTSHSCYNYVTDDPGEVKIFLTHPSSFEKATFYDDFITDLVFKDSILTDKWEKARPNRRYILKSFSSQHLKRFVTCFYVNSCCLVKQLKHVSSSEEINRVITETTVNTFAANIMGLKSMPFSKQLAHHLRRYSFLSYMLGSDNQMPETHSLFSTQKCFYERQWTKALPKWFWTRMTSGGVQAVQHVSSMKKLIRTEIEMRKRETSNPVKDKRYGKQTFFDIHVGGDGPYTDEEMANQLFFIMMAGTNTTAIALTLCLTFLGMHINVQEKLYQEIKTIVGLETFPEQVGALKYTEQVILETLRLVPTIPFIGRYVVNDIDLGSKVIPKGCNVILPIYLIHRNEKYWSDPLKFDPDRFSPQNAVNIEPGSFIPFSFGGRDCIGKSYGMMFMKITLANIIRNYKIVSNNWSIDELKLVSHIDVKPTGNVDCRLISRQDGGTAC
ncbi:uncharacterized protein LOC132703207 [Cylas formicarius]|uniref:uncharacterized protein LOC132703207 n=1 Tax=Cylas formicarius TaxID=197179 RepID=UPI002958D503|nr:uncharacterized protein LOC132703207 [Cylas formicarius]